MSETSETPIRAKASYGPLWGKFNMAPPSLTMPPPPSSSNKKNNTNAAPPPNNNPYNRQYSSLYAARLAHLRNNCLTNAKNVSTSDRKAKIVPRIIELSEEEKSTIVGVIIKDMPNLPKGETTTSYHSKNNNDTSVEVGCEPFRHHCDFKDTIVLEDESGRIELEFPKDENVKFDLVTGMIMAVTGRMKTGVMIVDRLHYPTFDVKKEDSRMSQEGEQEEESDAFIALVSGLDCGGVDENSSRGGSSNSFKREMLLDYLTGHMMSSSTNDNDEAPKICRLLVAGGGCAKPYVDKDASPYGDWDKASSKNKNNKSKSATGGGGTSANSPSFPVQELDLFLSEICAAGIPVDYIPGLHDPTNANWPQNPLHPCLLPFAERFVEMFQRTTNPYEATIGGKLVLGSDGLNIVDVRKAMANRVEKRDKVDDDDDEEEYSLEPVSTLKALHTTLKAQHIAPTGPHTLPIFPFENVDPFVMEKPPSVYFAGNCEEFDTQIIKGDEASTRLVCVPSFALTGQIVLLNLKSLECSVIGFDDIVEGMDDEKKMEE